MKNILIGGAWPYANGSLHIGHIASLLPGDIIARYYRAKGENVFYVSGSDCHGTPITIRAKQENKTPWEISEEYHQEFSMVFKKFGFSYDLYGKTTDEWHISFVNDFHKELYKSDYICENIVPQAVCDKCNKALADRLVLGICPNCGNETRGDQCDSCGSLHELENIIDPKCAECGNAIVFNKTKHLYLKISELQSPIKAYFNKHKNWRKNATAFTKRYIDEGLRDRAITRDLDWGINVPKKGYEDKKIYIWAENVLGYISASAVVAKKRGVLLSDLWGENARHYYVHGKDNIPFHTLILPALLLAHNNNWRLPDDIISSEYLTLEGRKISTSQNWAIWAKDVIESYNPDALRYFFIANGPEKRDTDFSWHEFVERNNSELLGAYGNFVNRTLAFIIKYQDGCIPKGSLSEEITELINKTFTSVGKKIENGDLKDAIVEIFEFIRYGNKYYDAEQPWKTRNADPTRCNNTLFNCVQIISNLAILLYPFLPFSSKKICDWLSLTNTWNPQYVPEGYILHDISILFDRLDKIVVDMEKQRLEKAEI